MAVPGTIDEFLDLVHKSGVADDKRLDAFLARARASLPADPAKVAGLLVQEAILTNFQADNILAGKWRRFSIGKYKVLEKLGSGGFAQVYLCEHKLMRRRVAVKVLPVAKTKDSSAKERFFREARAAATLDHPNIVHTYDIDQDEDLHFLVMEYVDGANLLQIVQSSGPLPVLRACHYILQAALAMQHAHEHGLVHRDIKPGNILVDRAGVVKILDLGLALNLREEDEQLTKKHDDGTLGTADYLSPEQAMDSHDVDIRTDIYSLGVTFYFLLTGKPPYDGLPIAQKLLAHQMRTPKPVREIRGDVPAGVQAIIEKMMAKKVDQRYSEPGEVADALTPYVQTAIAPPSDTEIPKLSPAATGANPTTDSGGAKADTPLRIAPGPMSAKYTPVAPPLTYANSNPKPVPVAMAQPVAVPVATAAPVETEEDAPWEQFAEDTDDHAANDNTPASPAAGRLRKKVAQEDAKKKSFFTLLLVLAFVIIPVFATTAIVAWLWFMYPKQTDAVKLGPPTFKVSKDPKHENAIRTIQAAVRMAQVDSVIELLDDVYEENVVIEPIRGRTQIVLKAAEGKEITWRSARKDPTEPILRIHKAAGFKLLGKGIILDGTLDKDRRVNDLISITLESPGMEIEELQMNHFARSAIFIMNAGGTPAKPMKLTRLAIFADEPDKTRGAIYFDANPAVTPPINDYITIDACDFRGYEAETGIRMNKSKNHPINGKDVRW